MRDDRRVDVADGIAVFSENPAHLAQQEHAVGALVGVVGIGKMLSDVAQRGGSEQRVHDRVCQYIRIGMTEQTVSVGNLHAAENQLSVFRKAVYVVTVSDTNQASPLLLKMLSASTTSTGVVSLMFSRLPSTICTSPPMFSISEQSSVTMLKSSASVSAKV